MAPGVAGGNAAAPGWQGNRANLRQATSPALRERSPCAARRVRVCGTGPSPGSLREPTSPARAGEAKKALSAPIFRFTRLPSPDGVGGSAPGRLPIDSMGRRESAARRGMPAAGGDRRPAGGAYWQGGVLPSLQVTVEPGGTTMVVWAGGGAGLVTKHPPRASGRRIISQDRRMGCLHNNHSRGTREPIVSWRAPATRQAMASDRNLNLGAAGRPSNSSFRARTARNAVPGSRGTRVRAPTDPHARVPVPIRSGYDRRPMRRGTGVRKADDRAGRRPRGTRRRTALRLRSVGHRPGEAGISRGYAPANRGERFSRNAATASR